MLGKLINENRLWNRLHNICGIQDIDPDKLYGVTRQSFSQDYSKAVCKMIDWMKTIGLETRMDAAGNLFGRLETDQALPTILVGSHFDTVPNGGRFDGLAGVMAALEAVTCIQENGIKTKYPIEVVALVNEEACQFKGGVMGSRAITGDLPLNHPFVTFDNQGKSLAEAMSEFGAEPAHLDQAVRKRGDFLAFIELHIEQASMLEQKGYPIGIVSSIAGIYQCIVKIKGRSAHAGAVPMKERKDALAAAAHITCEIERLTSKPGSSTRGTVGYISVKPSEHNIIAGEAEVPIDIREVDPIKRKQTFQAILKFIDILCEDRCLQWQIQITLDAHPVNSDQRLLKIHRNSAEELGIPHSDIISYAAHDSMILSKLCPIGMIFVRSVNGLSHCPEEFSKKEDLVAGSQVLLQSLVTISNQGL